MPRPSDPVTNDDRVFENSWKLLKNQGLYNRASGSPAGTPTERFDLRRN